MPRKIVIPCPSCGKQVRVRYSRIAFHTRPGDKNEWCEASHCRIGTPILRRMNALLEAMEKGLPKSKGKPVN